MKLLRLITGLAVLAAVWGCSGTKKAMPEEPSGSTAVAQAAAPNRIANPCKLLTQEEASEAIGAKLGPGELKRLGIITRCAYYNRAKGQELWLDVHNETAAVSDSDLFDSYTHMPDAKLISGIGDRALWQHDKIGSGLVILKGSRLVQVGLPRAMTTMTPAVEKAAKLIASRM